MSPRARNVDEIASDSEWETVVEPYADTWDFDASPVLIGSYVGSRQVEQDDLNNPGEKRMANVYEIEDASEGKKYSVWGTYAIDEAFPKITVGSIVRIEYHGKTDLDGGRTVRKFTVQSKR